MSDKWKDGADSMKAAFGTTAEDSQAAPEETSRKKQKVEDKQQADTAGGGVFESIMNASIAAGGMAGGEGVYDTLKKFSK